MEKNQNTKDTNKSAYKRCQYYVWKTAIYEMWESYSVSSMSMKKIVISMIGLYVVIGTESFINA